MVFVLLCYLQYNNDKHISTESGKKEAMIMKIIEHLTREQMSEKYPNTWLGLTNVKYANNDGVSLESADVVYTDKSRGELLDMQLGGVEDIIGWYTNDDGLPLGLIGVE